MSASMVRPRPMLPKPEKRARRKRSGLRRMSEKQAALNKAYMALRHQFLVDRRMCQVPECLNHSQQVHHRAGRGRNFLKTETWAAVCSKCHDWIERHKNKARAMGLITYQ